MVLQGRTTAYPAFVRDSAAVFVCVACAPFWLGAKYPRILQKGRVAFHFFPDPLYFLGPPARCPFTVSFLGEGSLKTYSNLSPGGPICCNLYSVHRGNGSDPPRRARAGEEASAAWRECLASTKPVRADCE